MTKAGHNSSVELKSVLNMNNSTKEIRAYIKVRNKNRTNCGRLVGASCCGISLALLPDNFLHLHIR